LKKTFFVLFLVCLICPMWAQKRKVDSRLSHYRVIAIDTYAVDAKTGIRRPSHADGKMGYVVLARHKDGIHVLVEYVGKYSDHDDIRNAVAAHTDPLLAVFDKAAVQKPEMIQAAASAAGFPNVDLSKPL
jgi:hypothetical protein